ncbi:MAG: glycosyltransferase family 2 protein, partial [Ktedonobacteraceae bacterium]
MFDQSIHLSVIIPVYNEEENIPILHENIHAVLEQQEMNYEVIYVDDGSSDGSFMQLNQLVQGDPHVRAIRLRRNFGQTAAISAGVDHSRGKILVFMDGDLQNDPADIPRLLEKIDEGYDVVSGWRK